MQGSPPRGEAQQLQLPGLFEQEGADLCPRGDLDFWISGKRDLCPLGEAPAPEARYTM